MVAARRSSSSGASLQKQKKAPLKKKRGNGAKAGFVSLINSWARNEATDMSMSVSTACQLLQDKLGVGGVGYGGGYGGVAVHPASGRVVSVCGAYRVHLL